MVRHMDRDDMPDAASTAAAKSADSASNIGFASGLFTAVFGGLSAELVLSAGGLLVSITMVAINIWYRRRYLALMQRRVEGEERERRQRMGEDEDE